MTINFDNVYIKEVSTVAGFDEKKGRYGKLYDKTYDDYYLGCKTFEQAEIKMIKDSVDILLDKSKQNINEIDLVIGADLSNQITANAYSSICFNRPYIGLYNACASMSEGFIVASSLLQNKTVKNVLINISSHNLTAERQFRNPVEYGAPKPKRSTFTVTGAASCVLTNEKTKIRVKSVSIGTTTDLGVTDIYDMGSVMAPSCAQVLYQYLKDTNTNPKDYDLILSGDLGIYGKDILKEYIKQQYDIKLGKNFDDASSLIYNRKKQEHVKAGGSGPACLPLVAYTDVINKMREGKYKKVLLIATGALMSTTMNNQKLSIPSISHLVCLERVL